MDIVRAISFFTEDNEWMPKLAIGMALGFGSLLLTLPLVGLAGWAVLLGYTVALIRNVRGKQVYPLPRWADYAALLQRGAPALTALIVYLLPNALAVCCIAATGGFWGDGFMGSTTGIMIICCLLPTLLAYNALMWPMFALGLGRFAEEGNIGTFFQFADLFAFTYQRHLTATLQFVVYSLLLDLAGLLLFAIPCIGWITAPMLYLTVSGHLTAQFADRIEPLNKARPNTR